ncbi:hypothetical protein L0222_11510 [bacterium]|nr:hypothetical protein [bacterium]
MKARIIMTGLLLILIAAAPLIAGKGGIKVSTVTVDCGDAKKETNILTSGGSARIWINVPAGNDTDNISYTISDKGKPIVNLTTFTVTGCGDGYFFGDITLPATQGTVTLSVECGDGTNVGSDSFQLE